MLTGVPSAVHRLDSRREYVAMYSRLLSERGRFDDDALAIHLRPASEVLMEQRVPPHRRERNGCAAGCGLAAPPWRWPSPSNSRVTGRFAWITTEDLTGGAPSTGN